MNPLESSFTLDRYGLGASAVERSTKQNSPRVANFKYEANTRFDA